MVEAIEASQVGRKLHVQWDLTEERVGEHLMGVRWDSVYMYTTLDK